MLATTRARRSEASSEPAAMNCWIVFAGRRVGGQTLADGAKARSSQYSAAEAAGAFQGRGVTARRTAGRDRRTRPLRCGFDNSTVPGIDARQMRIAFSGEYSIAARPRTTSGRGLRQRFTSRRVLAPGACRACSADGARARAAIRCAGPGNASATSSSCRRRSVGQRAIGLLPWERRPASRPSRRYICGGDVECHGSVYVRSRGCGPPAGTPLMVGRPRGRAERQYDRANQGRPPPSAGESN